MVNNLLKKIAKESGMEELSKKNYWTYQEYMSVVCTDEWQNKMNKITKSLKNKDFTW